MTNQVLYGGARALLLLLLLCCLQQGGAQTITDSAGRKIEVVADPAAAAVNDSLARIHSPRKASIRSAILPGWGQAYNKKYWKIPLVYGALGTTAGIFVYNVGWYKRFRFAYRTLATKDTANFTNVHPQLQTFVVERPDPGYLQFNRDEFRRNIDYTVLFFIVFWGLNVVDAAVDAHLKTFDVSPDLGLKFKPGFSEMAGTTGFSLVLTFK